MAHLWTTGNDDIDSATAEIAVLIRNACRVTCSEQDHYDQAMRLRNRIMAGTRELDGSAHHHTRFDGKHVQRPGRVCPGDACYREAVPLPSWMAAREPGHHVTTPYGLATTVTPWSAKEA